MKTQTDFAGNRLLRWPAQARRSFKFSGIYARLGATFLLALFFSGSLFAFPPAPHHLIYGMIRDEMGNPISLPGAEVILETSTGASIRSALVPGLSPGINYKLEVQMDAAVTPDRYKKTALTGAIPFKLRVQIGKAVYLPIEMIGDFSKLGDPAGATRINLTLGEDRDGDGLPDTWERALIAASGGKIQDVRPDDDPDGDGLSNRSEYLVGTFAYDDKDGFSLKVVEIKANTTTLEFIAVRARTYSLFDSTDLNTWRQVPFRLASDSPDIPDRQLYDAAETGVVRVSLPPASDPASVRFFRLRVD